MKSTVWNQQYEIHTLKSPHCLDSTQCGICRHTHCGGFTVLAISPLRTRQRLVVRRALETIAVRFLKRLLNCDSRSQNCVCVFTNSNVSNLDGWVTSSHSESDFQVESYRIALPLSISFWSAFAFLKSLKPGTNLKTKLKTNLKRTQSEPKRNSNLESFWKLQPERL